MLYGCRHDIQHNGNLHNGPEHKTLHNDTQHNDIKNVTAGIKRQPSATRQNLWSHFSECCYADGHYTECGYTVCRYSECCGTISSSKVSEGEKKISVTQRERERRTDRQTDRQTCRQIGRHTD